MGRKRKRPAEVVMPRRRGRNDPIEVMRLSSEEATMLGKPLYDGWACRGGPHGDAGYNRRRERERLRREIDEES